MANKKDLFKQSLTKKKVIKKAAPDLQTSEKIVQEVHTEEQSPSPAPKAEKEAVQRVTVDFPVSVYTALKYASFEKRITLKKYIVNLVKQDLGLDK